MIHEFDERKAREFCFFPSNKFRLFRFVANFTLRERTFLLYCFGRCSKSSLPLLFVLLLRALRMHVRLLRAAPETPSSLIWGRENLVRWLVYVGDENSLFFVCFYFSFCCCLLVYLSGLSFCRDSRWIIGTINWSEKVKSSIWSIWLESWWFGFTGSTIGLSLSLSLPN